MIALIPSWLGVLELSEFDASGETSIPEIVDVGFGMVEMVVVLLGSEAADRADLIALAKGKVERSVRQASINKREVVASDRRINMKETRGMTVTKTPMTRGNEKAEKRWPCV